MNYDPNYVTVKKIARKIHQVSGVVKRLASATGGLEQCSAHLTTQARKEAFTDLKRELERVGEWLTWATQTIDFLEVDGITDCGFLRPSRPVHPIY